MAFVTGAQRGIIHHYAPKLVAFEHDPPETAENIIIWIGGLTDGLKTVQYPSHLGAELPSEWSLAEILMSSSYGGWGVSSLASDAKELAQCVQYFRGIKTGKIVLMGHSTGCQDIMEYLIGPGYNARPVIDGGILQAAVSDRECMDMMMNPKSYERAAAAARAMVLAGKGEEILPTSETGGFFPGPVSARRWLSLASPNHDGDDDYFSSDLTTDQLQRTFGHLPERTPLCIIFSGSDEYMRKDLDKMSLLKRWTEIIKQGSGKIDEEHSGIVERASHNLNENPPSVVKELIKRVIGFII